jgi:hypothetical protein
MATAAALEDIRRHPAMRGTRKQALFHKIINRLQEAA